MVYRSYPDMSRALIAGLSDEINVLEPVGLHCPNGASSIWAKAVHKTPVRTFLAGVSSLIRRAGLPQEIRGEKWVTPPNL